LFRFNGYKVKDIDLETQKLKELIQKYNAGRASAEEKAQLEEWYEQLHGKEIEFANEEERDRLKQEINDTLHAHLIEIKDAEELPEEPSRGSLLSDFPWLQLAACVVLLAIGTAAYLSVKYPLPQAVENKKELTQEEDIAPGGNRATLTLADGSKIILDEAGEGIVANEGNAAINKTADGKVVYKLSDKQAIALKDNQIATPRGGTYQITLSDGTKVWLNAASTLTYPAAFTGKERAVALTGEAYFEVAKNTELPFIVKISDNIRLQVLGTHFNIMAYQDEAEVKTTLLEGSVKVFKNEASSLLKPGEQASIGKGSGIKVSSVNTEEAVAWKNGYFMFNDEPLESIMRKLSKWYAVDIVYQNIEGNLHFGGMVSRSKNISSVLRIMELTGNIHFKISPGDSSGKERRVIVMP